MAKSAHEELNAMNGAWWMHNWAGLYHDMLMDFGYEPYDEHEQPAVRLFFDPPGSWRIVPIEKPPATQTTTESEAGE